MIATALVFLGLARASETAASENNFILIYQQVHVLEAARVEIDRFTLYGKGSHGFQEDRITEVLATLRSAEDRLFSAKIPDGLQGLRDSFSSAVRGLEAYGQAFIKADPKGLRKTEELFDRKYDRLREALKTTFETLIPRPDLERSPDPFEEEIAAFPDAGGRERFQQASFLLEEKEFKDSLSVLTSLREQYRGTSAEGSLALRIVRSASKDGGILLPSEAEKKYIQDLDDLMSSGVYYPNAYEIYLKWRSMYQTFYYGVKGDAEIPNLLYLQKLNGLIESVQKRLGQDPKDEWAAVQLWLLVQLPVIDRRAAISGGSLFGGE